MVEMFAGIPATDLLNQKKPALLLQREISFENLIFRLFNDELESEKASPCDVGEDGMAVAAQGFVGTRLTTCNFAALAFCYHHHSSLRRNTTTFPSRQFIVREVVIFISPAPDRRRR